MISHGQRPNDWGINPEIVYGWGNISSVTEVLLIYNSIFLSQHFPSYFCIRKITLLLNLYIIFSCIKFYFLCISYH